MEIRNNEFNNFDSVEVNNDQSIAKIESKYIAQVYAWMVLALGITAISSGVIVNSPAIQAVLFSSKYIIFGLFIAQLFLVGYLSFRVNKMSYASAVAVFIGYAALTGITISGIFFMYTAGSILSTFAITALTFAVMSFVGYTTKTDLTKFGSLMMMGLIGIIIASIVNFFMQSSVLYYIISYVGVGVFVGLIAYDTQKIKAYAHLETAEMRKKAGILGALSLYLDFINLFLMLLRLLGRRN